jgi:hypothetical protein
MVDRAGGLGFPALPHPWLGIRLTAEAIQLGGQTPFLIFEARQTLLDKGNLPLAV